MLGINLTFNSPTTNDRHVCAGSRLWLSRASLKKGIANMAWIFFTAFIVVAVVGALVWNQAEDEMRENEKRIENMKAETKLYELNKRTNR